MRLFVPASCIAVKPTLAVLSIARVKASVNSASLGIGTASPINAEALSINTPLASPSSERSISPPSGCQAPFSSLLVKARAAVFAQPACPSTRSIHTGRSGKASSRSAAVGNSLTGQSFWSQPRPNSHWPSNSPGSKSFSRLMMSALSTVPIRSTCIKLCPKPSRCP